MSTLRPLPTDITTAQLRALVDAMRDLPTSQVTITPKRVTISATKRTTGEVETVFVASITAPGVWTAKAAPGLIVHHLRGAP